VECGLDSTNSGQGPVAGCCECDDEPSGSCATELVKRSKHFHYFSAVYFENNPGEGRITVHRPGDDPRKECGKARGSNVRYYPT
jgi:hypothetical protein